VGVVLKILNQISLQNRLRSDQISPEVFIRKTSSSWQNMECQRICSVWRIFICFKEWKGRQRVTCPLNRRFLEKMCCFHTLQIIYKKIDLHVKKRYDNL